SARTSTRCTATSTTAWTRPRGCKTADFAERRPARATDRSEVTTMKAVVTGASGFLGAHLARTLKDRGVEVRAADRSRGPALDDVDAGLVEIDVLDPASLRAAFEGQDGVFHLAAIISIVGGPTGEVWRVNVHGPRNAATVALECGVGRFVHCSSVHSFDLERCGPSLDESGPPTTHPDAPAYDRSKRAGEGAVRLVV